MFVRIAALCGELNMLQLIFSLFVYGCFLHICMFDNVLLLDCGLFCSCQRHSSCMLRHSISV